MINTVVLEAERVKNGSFEPQDGSMLEEEVHAVLWWQGENCIIYSGCESRKAILIILFSRVVDKWVWAYHEMKLLVNCLVKQALWSFFN